MNLQTKSCKALLIAISLILPTVTWAQSAQQDRIAALFTQLQKAKEDGLNGKFSEAVTSLNRARAVTIMKDADVALEKNMNSQFKELRLYVERAKKTAEEQATKVEAFKNSPAYKAAIEKRKGLYFWESNPKELAELEEMKQTRERIRADYTNTTRQLEDAELQMQALRMTATEKQEEIAANQRRAQVAYAGLEEYTGIKLTNIDTSIDPKEARIRATTSEIFQMKMDALDTSWKGMNTAAQKADFLFSDSNALRGKLKADGDEWDKLLDTISAQVSSTVMGEAIINSVEKQFCAKATACNAGNTVTRSAEEVLKLVTPSFAQTPSKPRKPTNELSSPKPAK